MLSVSLKLLSILACLVSQVFEKKYKEHVLEKKDASYVITVYGDAPFRDNIEGH